MYFTREDIARIIEEEYMPDRAETDVQSEMNIELVVRCICDKAPNNKWLKTSISSETIAGVLEEIRPAIQNSWVDSVYRRISY